jgi:hypothetical protein
MPISERMDKENVAHTYLTIKKKEAGYSWLVSVILALLGR